VQASNAGGTTSFEISNTNGVSTANNKSALYLSATGAEANAARIESDFTGTVATNHAQDLKFYYVGLSSSPTLGMTLNNSGQVGIGVASPSGRVHADGDAYTAFIADGTSGGAFKFYKNGSQHAQIFSDGSGDIVFRNNTDSERMRIDSSGNVGIGTSSTLFDVLTVDDTNPKISMRDSGTERAFFEVDSSDNFVINNKSASAMILETSDTERMRIDSSGNAIFTKANGAYLQLKDASAVRGAINVTTSDGLVFTTGASFTERMRIDSSGNVGIGQSSPSSYYAKNLVVGGGSAEEGITIRGSSSGRSYLMFADGTSGNEQYRGYLSYNHADDALEFASGASERMRITSAGDVLIGKTSSAFGTAGTELQADGAVTITRSGSAGGTPFFVNRLSNDGELAAFYKDGTQIGYIGSSGNDMYLGNGITGVMFNDANNAILPWRTNQLDDGNISIGLSLYRFKDLYLSNAAYLDKVIGHDDTNTYISFIGSDVTQFVQGGAEAMRLDASGNLLVNTSNSSATTGAGIKLTKPTTSGNDDGKLIITGETSTSAQDAFQIYSTGASAYRCFINYAGSIYATSTSITAISDESLKENIRDLDKGLDTVLALQPRRFDWKNGDGNDIMGFVAQEVEEVMPELVHDYKYSETETKLGLKMGDMVPTLVKAIQDQQDIIENLKSRIEQLEGAN
jgi:hypothetical protein